MGYSSKLKVLVNMPEDKHFMFFHHLSSSSLMDAVNIEDMPNLFQSKEETCLGKRKIDSAVKTEDESQVKRMAFFFQESLEEKEGEDVDMIEGDQEREDHKDNEMIMIDNDLENKYVVDFDGFF